MVDLGAVFRCDGDEHGELPSVSYQLSVVSCQLSVVSCQLSVVSCQLSVVSCQLSVVKVLRLKADSSKLTACSFLRLPSA
ncbi:MAG: hypothetical protein C0617_00320 [Desulfuromonas sp.]|nr:MAG: hypothetical protein C0617_00320 [Desulfuromonas sp.]